jgi:hypothetical protein
VPSLLVRLTSILSTDESYKFWTSTSPEIITALKFCQEKKPSIITLAKKYKQNNKRNNKVSY